MERGAGRRVWPWVLYALGCTAGIYCHTTMFIWPFAVGLALVACALGGLEKFDRQFWLRFVAANLAILILSAWWLYVSWVQMAQGLQNLAWNKTVGPREFVRLVLGSCFLTIEPYDRDKIVTTLLPILTIASLFVCRGDRWVRLLAVLFAATLLSFGILGAIKPIIIHRTLYWLSIFPLLIIATGIGRLPSAVWRRAAIAIIAVLLLNNLRVHYHEYEAQDWEQALTVLAADHQSVALIQGEGMRTGLGEACRIGFGRTECPFRVIVLGQSAQDPLRSPGTWRRAVTDLRGALQPGDRVYALRSYDYDPFAALKVEAPGLPAGWHDRFLQGPLPPAIVLRGSGG